MSMTTELAQRMKAAAIDAKELGNIARYTKGYEAIKAFSALITPDNVLALVEALEAKEDQRANWFHMAEKLGSELDIAEKRIADLERMESTLRPVGVMSQKAYCRLENRESRFIALWPRPEIYLPRKRPDDGVIVFARTAAGVAVEGE